MTIAAGFIASDGILLCADNLYSDGYTKTYGEKIFKWQGNGISLCFALAGNATIAKMTVEDCVRAISDLDESNRLFANVFSTIRNTVKYVQQDYVDKTPLESRLNSQFWMLIVIRTNESGLRMYSVSDGAIAPVLTYDCIGAGKQIGMYILEPSYRRNMSLHDTAVLARHALAAAKERVEGVGGKSHFVTIQGSLISPIEQYEIDSSEGYILEYREHCAKLLLDIGVKDLGDEEFDKRLGLFVEQVKWIRSLWRGPAEAKWDHLINSITKYQKG